MARDRYGADLNDVDGNHNVEAWQEYQDMLGTVKDNTNPPAPVLDYSHELRASSWKDGKLRASSWKDGKETLWYCPSPGCLGNHDDPGSVCLDSEYPDNNPKTAVGAGKLPLDLVPPSAIHALAEAFADGARKYGPYNWREKSISSSVYYAAALRHLTAWWDGEDLAKDSGRPHLSHALACLALIIDGQSVGKLNDNRPFPGAASRMQEAWLKKNDDEFKQI